MNIPLVRRVRSDPQCNAMNVSLEIKSGPCSPLKTCQNSSILNYSKLTYNFVFQIVAT